MRLRPTLIAILSLFLCPLAFADTSRSERIYDFHSDISLQTDGTLLVRETIVVNSAGNQIRHGIYRDFPTRYKDRLGNNYVVGFQLISTELDGYAEPSRIEDQMNGKRIYLGDPKYFVQAGRHTYVISYSTNRQLGFFSDHDQLYWNVTGNGWIFPIDHASATVALPSSISPGEVTLDGFTGPQSSMERGLSHSSLDDGRFQFDTTRQLGSHEGLSIVLSWPKGGIAPPTSRQQMDWFLSDNRDALLCSAAFLILLLYYGFVWYSVGRDPKPGVIMPLYEPPSNLSPAAMRYLVRMGSFDNKTFASAVLDMAARGFLTIRDQAGSYTLYRTEADNQALSSDEQLLGNLLFGGRDQLWLHNENHTLISAGIKSLKQWLKTAEQKIYFFTNSQYLLPAIFFSVIIVLYATFQHAPARTLIVAFLSFWLSFWSIAVFALVGASVVAWKDAFRGTSGAAAGVGKALLLSLFALPFVAGEGFAIFAMTQFASVSIAIFLFSCVALHILFRHLLKAPTVAGRKLLDQIEGFKMFLGAVDGDRLNRMNPPEQTPQTFERFLPYAFALDLEQAWSRKFAGILGAAGAAPSNGTGYAPSFYSGSNWNSFTSASGNSFASSFATAISSSSSAPGSSDGGGGSGGGGGGGGGGGW
jgi:uncharacterized membrane protein YgcG